MDIIKSEHDFYTSVDKALTEISPDWKDHEGLLVVGSHTPAEIDEKLEKIKFARHAGIPFLGICFGMQLMLIEYARNKVGVADATSEEVGPGTHVIAKLPELRVGLRPVTWNGRKTVESHWHNYAFLRAFPAVTAAVEEDFNGSYTDGILEIAKLKHHPFFMGIQFHPEYQSSKKSPHPVLAEFVNACKKHTAESHQA